MTMAPETLRQAVARIERREPHLCPATPASLPGARWCFGVDAIDAHLPGQALSPGALMEITPGDGPDDIGAAAGFALALLARLADAYGPERRGDILWCQTRAAAREFGIPYMPGLTRFGLAPDRLLAVTVRKAVDQLWALEESLRSGALTAVIGEGAEAGFTAARRLALAAGSAATPCLLVDAFRRGAARAADLRWRVGAAPSGPEPFDPRASGSMRWTVTLTRARGGRPGAWMVEWNDATRDFSLVSRPADRTAAPHPPEGPRHAVAGPAARRTGHTGHIVPIAPLRRAG